MYRALFRVHLCEKEMTEIRESTNSGWVLGSERFKGMIEEQLSRRVAPKVEAAIENQRHLLREEKSNDPDPIDPWRDGVGVASQSMGRSILQLLGVWFSG